MKKKLRPIVWDNDARLYFKAAIGYIKKESVQGAKKVKAEIFKTVELLPENPQLFEIDKLKTDNDGSYRAFIVYHYRITYKVTADSIQIIRMRHTSQEPLEH